MNTINNQFAKVFNFPDGQLLIMLQYDVHNVAETKPELTYLVMVTEREDCVAEIKKRYVNVYEAREAFITYDDEWAAGNYKSWQERLRLAGTDIRLSYPATEQHGQADHHS